MPSEPKAGPLLRVRTLGSFAVWVDDEPVPAERGRRRKLFKGLLSAPGCKLHHYQILEHRWPEVTPDQAAANLRKRL
jgi:DNA-binding SARP family transcriptional activator